MKKLVQLLFLSVFAIVATVSCSKDDPIAPAKYTIDLSTKDFGDVEVEKTDSQTFKITNDGGQDLELKTFTLKGTNASEFSNNAVAKTLKAGKSYSFTVTFAPTTTGNKSASISIDTNVGAKTISLTGNATAKPVAMFSINPSSKDYGDVEVNQTAEETFVITNTGNADLEISGFTATVNNYNPFPIISTLNFPVTIAPNASLDVKIAFKPQTIGNYALTYEISTNVGTQNLSLTGNAISTCNTAVNIPDVKFKNALLAINGLDSNQDGVICTDEASSYNGKIIVKNYDIRDLTGIEAFTNITELDCRDNQLTSLNVSSNTSLIKLHCSGNRAITTLDVTKNIKLEELNCSHNQISSLDVTKNTALIKLYCSKNQLTSLDVTKNTALDLLYFSSNQITTIDVTKNTSLKKLHLTNTQVATLDVSKNILLEFLDCQKTKLTSLDLTKNTALKSLLCGQNPLTSLNVANGNNASMQTMYAQQNPNLTCIQIDANFTPGASWKKDSTANWSTNCSATACATPVNIPDANFKNALLDHGVGITNSGVSKIDVNGDGIICTDEASTYAGTIAVNAKGINDLTGLEAFTKITKLFCTNNQLNTIDISSNTKLVEFSVGRNNLTSLDVSKNTALENLSIYGNKLTSIDLSNNSSLKGLNCTSNQLTSLNVTQNTNLIILEFASNQITTIDVSNNVNLTRIYCDRNQMSNINVSNNTNLREFSIGTNQFTSLDVSSNSNLRSLQCNSNQITSLNLSNNTKLQVLSVVKNQFTSLNLSSNSDLRRLDLSDNQVTSLDLSNNPNLHTLHASSNQMNNLNISNNPQLGTLSLSKNKFTSLDISSLTRLTIFACHTNNDLTSLNVANGNNSSLQIMNANWNPKLTCIQHDAGFDPTTNSNWLKINTPANWSTNCQ